MASVAVLLAAYNGTDWIGEQLQSILNQGAVDVHVFISVDLSSDGTFEWCQAAAIEYPNVTVLKHGERFGGAAKNFYRLIRDVDFSGFDYIALADQDDIWLKAKLSRAVDKIQSAQLDAFSSDVVAFWEGGREALVKKSFPQKQLDFYFEAAGAGCTYVFKQQALMQFKLFLQENWLPVNQVSAHDWIIYSYFRVQGLSWYIDDLPLMRYRQHAANQVGFNSGIRAYSKRLSLVRNKWYRGEVLKISALINGINHTEFSIKRWFLITHIWHFRRRRRDVIALLFMLLTGIF